MKATEIPLLSLGHSCIDAIIAPSSVQFLPDNGVQLDMSIGESLLLRYCGEPIGWNEKRDATEDPSLLLSHADAFHYGGGGWNSTMHSLLRDRRATLVDEVALPNAGLLTSMGGQYQSANPQISPSVNLVVHDRATGNRICLRGPRRQNQGSTQPRMPEVGPHAALLINSARDARLVEECIRFAEENGKPVVAIGNDSLPLASRLPLLFCRSQVAIENLSEFGQVAVALEIACPGDEATANLRMIAAAMLAVRHTTNSGHLAVTLGRRGCLVLDARLGKVLHVCVGGCHRQEIDLRLHRRVGGVNGAGDMFAAAFTTAFVKMEARRSNGTVFFATRLATAEVCTALCPSLAVPESAVEMNFVEPHVTSPSFRLVRCLPCTIPPTAPLPRPSTPVGRETSGPPKGLPRGRCRRKFRVLRRSPNSSRPRVGTCRRRQSGRPATASMTPAQCRCAARIELHDWGGEAPGGVASGRAAGSDPSRLTL